MKRWCTYLAAFFLALWLMLIAFFSVGLNDEVYCLAQLRAGVTPENSGLSPEEWRSVDRQTAMFLARRGSMPDGLSENGQTHMTDVRRLFSAARGVMIASLFLAAALYLLGGRGLRSFRRAYAACTLFAFGLLLTVSLIGTDRFERLFSAFHSAVFSNRYWLMNPETDAIIRVMPIAFFENMALYTLILASFLWLVGGLLLAVAGKRRKSYDENRTE